MRVIDLDVFRSIKKIIEDDDSENGVLEMLAKDSIGNPCIRPAKFTVTGSVFPELTIDVDEAESEPVFPATKSFVRLIVWVDPKRQNGNYSFLKRISDKIIKLINREGDKFNDFDIKTDNGVRYCQFLKISRSFEKDAETRLNYVEMIFEVVHSEDEIFDEDSAGNQTWV